MPYHILIPIVGCGDNAIIIEYKVSKDVKALESTSKFGLAQINDQQYDAKIKDNIHIKKIIKIALSFYGKAVAVQYQIDEIVQKELKSS